MAEKVALHFDTWTAFLDAAIYGEQEIKDRRSSREGSVSFTGTKTWEDAVELSRKGWPEGVKKAQAIANPLQEKLYSKIQLATIQYDTTGTLLDVGRFAVGEPEHWGNWEYSLIDGEGTKYVHIVMNGTASCGIEASVLIARGAVVSALVNLLELGGCRAKVTLAYAVTPRADAPPIFQTTVTLKQYDEPLDLDRLTYALAHPSTFRRLFFSLMECQPTALCHAMGVPRGGYGSQGDLLKADQGDIYLGSMSYGAVDWENPESAERWALKHLQELGVLQPAEEQGTN